MKTKRIITGSVLAAVLGFGISYGVADGVSRETWATLMQDKVPQIFCAEGSFFRECFTSTQEECYEQATAVTATCLQDYLGSIPDPISDENRWRREVSTCAGKQFHTNLLHKRISNDAFNDPKNWFK